MVLWAPDTAGPWSAVTIRHISMNWQAYLGNLETGVEGRGQQSKHRVVAQRVYMDC